MDILIWGWYLFKHPCPQTHHTTFGDETRFAQCSFIQGCILRELPLYYQMPLTYDLAVNTMSTHWNSRHTNSELIKIKTMQISSLIPRPFPPPIFECFAVCKNGGGGRSIYHMNDVNVYLCRQRGEGSLTERMIPNQKNDLDAFFYSAHSS